MDNFQKRIFLSTITNNLEDMNVTGHRFKEVFSFINQEFGIKNSKYESLSCFRRDFSDKNISEFKKTFKEQIKNQISKISRKETLLEKKLKILKKLFFLEEDEYQIFIYYSFSETNEIFSQTLQCFDIEKHELFRTFLGIKKHRLNTIMTDLYKKTIFTNRRFHEYSCNPVLIDIIENDKYGATPHKITSAILGEKQKSSLTEKDFSYLKDDMETVVKILKSAAKQQKKRINILLYGSVGTGKTEFAKLTANIAKLPIYQVAVESEDFKEAKREDRLYDFRTKNHLLSINGNACLLFDEAEDVMNRGFSMFGSASKGYFNNMLENVNVPVIWTTNNIHDVDPAFLRRMTYCIGFEKLSEETRLNIWNKVLKKNKLKVNKEKVKELNKYYDIPPSLIANAVQTTKMIDGNECDFEQFIENVAKIVTKKKSVKKAKEFEFADYNENLVNTDLDIKNLTEKIKSCGKLNFSLCLYGEPGTGKSLYARYLAKELGLDVIFKRASDIMSKYVGESEKNIADAFAEAKTKKAMLIFDEADSFLQNRNNAVRSWEVSQVNEMLTRMESHEYPFVCTTNLLDTMDEASLRRFTFKIKFEFLTKEQANDAFTHFFDIKDYDLGIKGLTAGDFATVKKKADFLNITDADELKEMLMQEVKLKSSKELKNSVGF